MDKTLIIKGDLFLNNDPNSINMNVVDAIKERYSVRNFEKYFFDTREQNTILDLLKNTEKGPFGNKARFVLIEKPEAIEKENVKLGTYGFISNAVYFIAGAIEKFEFAEVDYGYILEKIILELTHEGYATCWLGGTFSRKDYQKILNLDNKEIIPAITPVGIAAEKKSFRERLGLKLTDGSVRYLFETLFFDESLDSPLYFDESDPYMMALEMIRLAPSAVNRQPWRVIKNKNKYHFYIYRNKLITFNKTVDLQKVDLGIALAHFHLTLQQYGQKGLWHIKNPEISDMEYVITWIAE